MKELLEKYLDKRFSIWHEALRFNVVVLDIKQAYGSYLFNVKPLSGVGSIWVKKESLQDYIK